MIYPKETQDEVCLQPEHRILTPDSWGTFQRVDFTKVRLLHLPKHSKGLSSLTQDIWHSLINSNLLMFPAMRETWIQSLGEEDPLEKEMATHSSILAWKTPWTEKPCLWSHKESDTTERLHFLSFLLLMFQLPGLCCKTFYMSWFLPLQNSPLELSEILCPRLKSSVLSAE